MTRLFTLCSVLAVVFLSIGAPGSATESAAIETTQAALAPAAPPVALPPDSQLLPPYEFPYTDGLYASAAGYISVKNVCFPCQKAYTVCVNRICDRFPVKAAIQDGPAPLVIFLSGIGGRPEDDFNKLWPSWYYEQGYHVLSFESTFLQDFNARTHLGVNGNVWVETEYVRDIIDAFLHQSPVSGRVTKIGVVGMSYGGVEALILGTMAAEKKLPFEIDAIQSYSPPLRLEQSARIIDGWYAETYGKYTLVELLKLTKITPDRSNPNSLIPQDKLKAAVSTSFRLALPGLVAYTDKEYCLNKLPKGDEFTNRYVREDYASKWSFIKYAYGMSYSYWQRELALASLEPLIHAADLPVLVQKQPETTEVILAEDDPLNSADEMKAFKAQMAGKRVTFLTRGGHLGYVAEPWTKAKLMTLFNGK